LRVQTLIYLGVGSLLLWLVGCGTSVKYTPGIKFLESREFPQKTPPPKIQVKMKTVIYQGKSKSGFTTLLSSIPAERYRFEFKGPLGGHLGDFYWVKDSTWTLSIPSENLLTQGEGQSIQLPYLSLDSLDINFVFGFLWGQLARPGVYQFKKASKKTVEGWHQDGHYRVLLETKTGQIKEAYSGIYTLKASAYKSMNNQLLPTKLALFKENKLLLTMDISKINIHPTWKRSPFFIPAYEP